MRAIKLLFRLSLLLAIVLVAVAVRLYWVFTHPSPAEGLNYIQGTSGVRFPPGVTNFVSYDRGESFVTAHLTLPPAEIAGFAQRYHFIPSQRSDILSPVARGPNPTGWLREPERLPAPFSSIPSAPLLSHFGRTRTNTWTFVLAPRTGDLWVTVEYPDPQGGPP